MRLQKKSKMIILGVAVVIIALIGGRMVFGGGTSPEQTKKELETQAFAIDGWGIKHVARLAVNKEKVLEFKQQLMDYYSAESGALVEQQRLIDALTAADTAAANDDNSGEKILSFNIDSVTFSKKEIAEDKASLTATIAFYMRYYTHTQTYSTLGKNTYNWELKKEKGKWKITKEELVPVDDTDVNN